MLRHLRHLSTASATTTATAGATTTSPLYAFKKQLDEYVYFHSLSSQWRPAVYRKRNADKVTALNALDKKNHPIGPKTYPGVPSKKKLVKFISLLVHKEELASVRESLGELFKVRITKDKKHKYLDPSVVNQFLYKSYQLGDDTYTKNLIWVDQIDANDSVWSVKNTEAVAFINAFRGNSMDAFKLSEYESKMQYWIGKAGLEVEHSILFNASNLIAAVNDKSGSVGDITSLQAYKNLDALTANKVYTVKEGTEYMQYDHAYSILSALRQASTTATELVPLVSRWDKFMQDVSVLHEQHLYPSTYDQFVARE